MQPFLSHTILNEHFLISAQRTVFWEEEKTLILSDLHLGKSGHFRKSGIAIPQNLYKEDLFRLLNEIHLFSAKKLIIVGDLFHSSMNKEHELFLRWRKDISRVDIHLIKGNHDILKNEWYKNAEIQVHKKHLAIRNFSFTHDINECQANENDYCFSGHIHPAVFMRGIAKQSITLPCFYFAKNYAVLPAFGKFTGTFAVKPTSGESVFALVENKVMKLQ